MSNRKHDTNKPQKRDFLYFFILGIILSSISFYTFFINQYNNNVEEVVVFFESYEYYERDYKSPPRFFINTSDEKFNIPSYLLNSFDMRRFTRDIKKGDSLTFLVDGTKIIYQIKKKQTLYIEKKSSIENINKNNFLSLILGIVFLILTILFGFLYNRSAPPATASL